MEAARFIRLAEKLGTDGMDDLDRWLTEELQKRGITRDEYREVLSRLDNVEQHLGGLEKRVDGLATEIQTLRTEMNARFDQMNMQTNERFDRMNERFDRMNERFDRMNERFDRMMRWTVGMIGTVGGLIAILITIFKFLG